MRLSLVVEWVEPSSAAFLKSLIAVSSFSTSDSSRPFLCCSEVISCSLARLSCSRDFILVCISSTLAAESSASRRSWFIFCVTDFSIVTVFLTWLVQYGNGMMEYGRVDGQERKEYGLARLADCLHAGRRKRWQMW